MCFIPRHIYLFFTAASDFARECFVPLFLSIPLMIDEFNLFLFVSFFVPFFCFSHLSGK